MPFDRHLSGGIHVAIKVNSIQYFTTLTLAPSLTFSPVGEREHHQGRSNNGGGGGRGCREGCYLHFMIQSYDASITGSSEVSIR